MVADTNRRAQRLRPTLTGLLLTVSVVVGACGSTATVGHPLGHEPTTPSSSIPASGPGLASPYRWTADAAASLDVGGGPTTTLAAVLAPAPPPAAGSLWQIAGTRTNADGTTTATVWSSTDARTWTSTDLSEPSANGQALAATTWDGRTVIVGSKGAGATERAAAWLSLVPGGPFQEITAPGVFAAPGTGATASMDVVASGDLGVFAAGTLGGVEAVWYSTDARHWIRLKDAEKVIDGATRPRITSLLVAANGVFAAGSVADGSHTDAAVWSSTDGITWTRVLSAQTAFTGDGDHTISGLVSIGTGFVAVGAVRSGASWSPASWISPDGRSWSQPSQAFPIAPGVRNDSTGTKVNGLASVATDPSTTVATGQLAAVGGSRSAQHLWTSHNGTSWSEVDLPAGAADAADWRAGKVATNGATTIIIDDSAGSPRVLVDDAAGWDEVSTSASTFGAPRTTATPVRLLSYGKNLVLVVNVDSPGQALGTETTSAAILTSTDGTTWTSANATSFGGHTVRDATSLASGLVAVGNTSPLTSSLAAGPTGASAWYSPDGNAWTLSPETPATFGGGASGAAQANAVTRLGQTVIAVGAAALAAGGVADQAVAWTSANGQAWSPSTPLDAVPSLGTERPLGLCAGSQSVVAVGTGVAAGPQHQAMAWSSSDGQHWRPATVSPPPASGIDETMESCITTGNGFIAFGSTEGSGGTTDAAIWYSNNGTQWARQTVGAFTGSGLGPIKDVAIGGTTWLAVSGGNSTTSNIGIWRTSDAGTSWQRIDTTGPAWTSSQDVSFDRVAFAGTTAVVAGQVDGRLTVWVGSPPSAPDAAATASPTTASPTT